MRLLILDGHTFHVTWKGWLLFIAWYNTSMLSSAFYSPFTAIWCGIIWSTSTNVIYLEAARHRDVALHGNHQKINFILYYLHN